MDISTTSNMFICLAEVRSRAGDDIEDIAKELATALKAVIYEELADNKKETIITEFAFLCGFHDSTDHRYPKER